MDNGTIAMIMSAGGFCTAIWGIWRLVEKVKAEGAARQSIENRLDTLEKEAMKEHDFRTKIYDRLDKIRDELHEMTQANTRDHAELEKKIIRLESAGCAPTQGE